MFLTIGVLYKATTINVQFPDWLKLLIVVLSNFLGKVKVARMLQRTIKFLIKQEALKNILLLPRIFRFFRFEKVVIFSFMLISF